MQSGNIYIVSGPSGTGKTTLCAAFLKQSPMLRLSISCTTRPPRLGEVDGRDYHFLPMSEFELLRIAGGFLESAFVHGNYYGTRAADVQQMLDSGLDVLLEIDWQGAAQVAARITNACRIFILPPNIDELRARLTMRGQDSTEVINRRVAAAQEELRHAHEAEFRIINDEFDHALHDLLVIYRAHQLRHSAIGHYE